MLIYTLYILYIYFIIYIYTSNYNYNSEPRCMSINKYTYNVHMNSKIVDYD